MISSNPAVVEAVQAMDATGADRAVGGTLVARVDNHMAAITKAEEVLREAFTGRELARLTGLLIDMHTDPLADNPTIGEFMDDL